MMIDKVPFLLKNNISSVIADTQSPMEEPTEQEALRVERCDSSSLV